VIALRNSMRNTVSDLLCIMFVIVIMFGRNEKSSIDSYAYCSRTLADHYSAVYVDARDLPFFYSRFSISFFIIIQLFNYFSYAKLPERVEITRLLILARSTGKK
jgi:hypothetical protein